MATLSWGLAPSPCRIGRPRPRRSSGASCQHSARLAGSSSCIPALQNGSNVADSSQESAWIAALDGLEYEEEQQGSYDRRKDEKDRIDASWNPLKYKAPWTHADEQQPRVDERTWRRKDPVLSTISGYPLGYNQTSTNPPLVTSYEQFQQHEVAESTRDSSAVSQIADNLRRIKAPQRDIVPQRNESRIGNLVNRLVGPAITPPGESSMLSTFPSQTWNANLPAMLLEEPPKPAPKFPWEMEDFSKAPSGEEEQPQRRVRPPSLAELVLPDAELRRLRTMIIHTKERIKVKKLGITRNVVQAIHQKWRTSEIVKLKCDQEVAMNMRKVHEELEKRTGGLVIWRAGAALVIYRGKDYAGPPKERWIPTESVSKPKESVEKPEKSHVSGELLGIDTQFKEFVNHIPFIEAEYEMQMDRLLAELGPRYADWKGDRPVPVDGDKLPAIDHNFKSPYRLLPYGMEPKLSDREFTNLVRLARQMPPQFVISRNKGLQGLAKAMVKLWEKTEITKVAIKQSVQSTDNAKMADELKRLTGCVLLGREKTHMIFYRGKDFLPAPIAAAFEEREAMSFANKDVEDKARMLPTGKVTEKIVHVEQRPQETEADIKLKEWIKNQEEEKRRAIVMKAARAARARRIERRLDIAVRKKEKAEEALSKVEKLMKPREPSEDRETITEEERYTLQRVGLKMKAFLLLGRRGVYSGIIENMHLHWKYRELVKVVYKGKDRMDIEDTAKMIECESGGILIGIYPVSKGQVFLYYRGKNYRRPEELRPHNLLTKRKALARYTETQRRESLSRYILSLEHDIRSLGYILEKAKADESESDEDAGSDEDASDADVQDDNSDDKAVQLLSTKGATQAEMPVAPPLKRYQRSRHLDLGPILRAEPLSNRERLILRKRALLMGKPSHFHIGKCNLVGGLITSIRIFLKKRALVKIGMKGRALGTSVQELVKLIEDGTGAAFVCQEKHKLIFYRGWPEGTKHPAYMDEDLSADLVAAVKEEDGTDYAFADESREESNTDMEGDLANDSGDETAGEVSELESSSDDESSEEDYSDEADFCSGEADFGRDHADNSAPNYRKAEEESAYSTGEESDDEVWSVYDSQDQEKPRPAIVDEL
ncbi:CRM-domain containing factor CFM2, chloroplastic [Selaginella moellendorffii]|uniref:CRM-domain containing factor CFM2, chloroplastic n=1 Tax=Selaginella moellendorffii TaxID=88036 RepID=UPI000D1D02BB|nr:CRM-domain containing factor CFM2, chloroplastic [Selaginella moellendorffii]|eukprot:XP_024525151.1 CRM-domain containing factor CFM2, chloroplastic [Selaginella moellendorffii]